MSGFPEGPHRQRGYLQRLVDQNVLSEIPQPERGAGRDAAAGGVAADSEPREVDAVKLGRCAQRAYRADRVVDGCRIRMLGGETILEGDHLDAGGPGPGAQ
jgi:hypothetical protein